MTGNSGSPQLPERLRKAAESLNRESDSLTATLRQVEKALNSLGLGVFATLKEPVLKETEMTDSGHIIEWVHNLGYGKCGGKSANEWGIFIETEGAGDPTYTGVPGMSRELRVAAAKNLPALLDLLTGEVEKLVGEIQGAKASAEEAAKKLQG